MENNEDMVKGRLKLMDLKQINPKKLIYGVVITVSAILLTMMSGSIFESVGAGEYVIIQKLDGELVFYDQPTSFAWQSLGTATHYRRSSQFEFYLPSDQKDNGPGNSIEVKWNDGGHANISGSIRYDLPTTKQQMVDLHKKFGSQLAIEQHLIKTNMEKAIFMCGPIMSSKESYAEKKNDLIFYIEDQAKFGVYKTKQVEVEETDPFTNLKKISIKVQLVTDEHGQTIRQEKSPISEEGIKLYNLSINKIKYDKIVEDQIATQQQALMQIQTAMAKSKEAEQRALTVAKEGEADAAKAKWEQEVIKAKMVTEAEARNAQAKLDVQTAVLRKQTLTLEGEGEAAKKRAIMQANGALEQKLEAWLKAQELWASALAGYTGSIVPAYISGGTVMGTGGTNAFNQFMEMSMFKTARDLDLDLRNNKKTEKKNQ